MRKILTDDISLAKKAISKHNTPFYLVNIERLIKNLDIIEKSFPENTRIAYAMKANYTPSVLKTLDKEGTNFDVFSPGELKLLEMCSCDLSKVVYTSVAETEKEFTYALENNVERFVLGSINGILNFKKALDSTGREKTEVLIRTQPIRKVNAAVSTSGEKSKFGVLFTDDKDSVKNAISEIKELEIDFGGFHFHLGSKLENPSFHLKAIDKVMKFIDKNDIDLKTFDIGGGYPIKEESEEKPVKKFGKKIGEKINEWREKIGKFELIIEPGRSLVSETTFLAVNVVNIKNMYNEKTAIVNGSEDMVSLGRHDTKPLIETITKSENSIKTKIAGNFCHSEDWLVEKPIKIPDVKIGDTILFKNVGAYLISHNIPYNLRKIPLILSYKDGKMSKEKHPFQIMKEVGEVYRD